MNRKTCLKITYDRFLSPQFSYAQIVRPNRMSRQVCGWKFASGPSVHQSVHYQTGKPVPKADHHCISLSTITLQQHAATVNGWCLCCKSISKSVSCQTTTVCSSSQWLKSAASPPVKSVPHQTTPETSSSQWLKSAASPPVRSVPHQTTTATSSGQWLKPGLRMDGPPRPQPATVKLTSVLEVDQQRLPPLHAFVQTHGQVGQRLVVCGLQQLWTNKHTVRISVMFF